MDFANMTYGELFKIYHQLGWEMFTRTWWILVVVAVALVLIECKLKK